MECDNDFVDSEGRNCLDYIIKDWCTDVVNRGHNGLYGDKWFAKNGPGNHGKGFDAYPDPKTGLTALSCDYCGCKGNGLRILLSAPLSDTLTILSVAIR